MLNKLRRESLVILLFVLYFKVGYSQFDTNTQQKFIINAYNAITVVDTGNVNKVAILLANSTKNKYKTDAGIKDLIAELRELKLKYSLPKKEMAKLSVLNLMIPDLNDTTKYKSRSVVTVEFDYIDCDNCRVIVQFYTDGNVWNIEDISVIYLKDAEKEKLEELMNNFPD